jgi:hypothetical protein
MSLATYGFIPSVPEDDTPHLEPILSFSPRHHA